MLSNIARENHDEARELRSLFEKHLRELYWGETALLPLMGTAIKLAWSKDLIALLGKHRAEATSHINRLERIFSVIGLEPETMPYEGLQCLIDEAENLEGQTREGVVRDAALIAVLQKIKHHEIACYGTMRAFAIALREEDAIPLLERTLHEEKEADLALSHIAESHINIEAADKEI